VTPISRSTPLADLPEMLRVDEASRWLGISKGLCYELCRTQQIQSVKFGRLTRVPKATLERYVNAHTTTAPEAR
jgi:excisionase family DNA binding protein